MNLLEVTGVSFAYEHKSVLEDVSIDLGQGKVMCLIGPNGCGKSTLQGCILCFHRPSAGEILINGKPNRRYNAKQLASVISFVPQAHKKTFPYTVSEIVLMGRTFAHGAFSSPDEKDEALALAALDKVGLKGFADRRYTELSGGELQLVLIARSLCQDSPLMLLDEPTAHLDFKHELNVLDILARLVRETGLTILMASHSLNHPFFFESEGVETEVALMNNGRILQIGAPREVCTGENLFDVYGIESRLKVHREDGKERYYLISWKK